MSDITGAGGPLKITLNCYKIIFGFRVTVSCVVLQIALKIGPAAT